MAVMENGDFELSGVLLKGTADYPIYVLEFDPGKSDHRHQDAYNPLDDTVQMGRDYVSPPDWEFKLGMGDFTQGPALEALGELMKIWRNPQREPGAVLPLKYMVGGRVRQVFGRPRPFSFNPEMLVGVGYVVAVAGFHLQDGLHYDTTQRRLTIDSQIQEAGGGFTAPFYAPILTTAGNSRNSYATNNGSASTPFTARFYGPTINPKLTGPGWNLALDYTISEGDWVEVDTRNRTAKRKSGADVSGVLSRKSRLLSARLKPGRSELLFTGNDPTGISRVDVSWFDAYLEH